MRGRKPINHRTRAIRQADPVDHWWTSRTPNPAVLSWIHNRRMSVTNKHLEGPSPGPSLGPARSAPLLSSLPSASATLGSARATSAERAVAHATVYAVMVQSHNAQSVLDLGHAHKRMVSRHANAP